jgi:hypothetical protein
MWRRVWPFILLLTPLSALAAPSNGAAADERQDAANALGMDSNFDSFDESRFELMDSQNNANRVAVASAYDCDDGRVKSNDSGGWVIVRRGESTRGEAGG